MRGHRVPRLRVSATNAFVSGVLPPNLDRWTDLQTGIELEVHTSDHAVDLIADEVDIAVRYAPLPSADSTWEPLWRDRYLPMLKPALGVDDGQILDEACLLTRPLIDYRWRKADAAQPTWERWRESAMQTRPWLPCLSNARMVRLSREGHAIEAAMSGQGVVLASDVITYNHRKQGRLGIGSPISLAGLTYFLVDPPRLKADTRLVAFRQWLVSSISPPPDEKFSTTP